MKSTRQDDAQCQQYGHLPSNTEVPAAAISGNNLAFFLKGVRLLNLSSTPLHKGISVYAHYFIIQPCCRMISKFHFVQRKLCLMFKCKEHERTVHQNNISPQTF